ncbi:MAG TPA: hypothetical protein VIU64_20900 [Polyangia bacterium]
MGAPWYIGAPLDDRKVIPDQSRALTVAEHRRAYEAAHAERRALIELQELLALEERGALRPDEHKRLVELIAARARDWSFLNRPLALVADLRHLVALAPGRAMALAPRLRAAELAAGDEWLALGETARAEDEYRRAEKLGGEAIDYRFRAVWGASVADLDADTLERALSELPDRVLAPFSVAYLDSVPAPKPRLLRRSWQAARVFGPPELLARLEALPFADRFPLPPTKPVERAADEPAGVEASEAPVGSADGAAADAPPTSRAGGAGAGNPRDPFAPWLGESRPASPSLQLPAADDALDRGPTLARVLLPLAHAFPQILQPGPRSRRWSEQLLAEDPNAPDSLELAALIDALAGRIGGAQRKLRDLVFFSRDRAAANERAARVWQVVGRSREECTAWKHATRVGAVDDPRWCELLACVQRDPGAGDAATVAAHIRARAPALACAGEAPAPFESEGASPPGPGSAN